MPRYHLTHRTIYDYSMPVAISRHTGFLKPMASARQKLESYQLSVHPIPAELCERRDYFGNSQIHFQIEEPHTRLTITAESRVATDLGPGTDTTPAAVSSPESSPDCAEVREFLRRDTSKESLGASMMAYASTYTLSTESIDDFAFPYLPANRPYLEATADLCAAIYQQFQFDPHATDVATPVSEVFRLRRGVCQDFAHLMLTCLRARELPARYVSGYILTEPPPGESRLQGADASHAWVSVFVPGSGWIDFDPTNNLRCVDQHITVAFGRDYADVSPLRGAVIGGGTQEVRIEVTMEPEIHEAGG